MLYKKAKMILCTITLLTTLFLPSCTPASTELSRPDQPPAAQSAQTSVAILVIDDFTAEPLPDSILTLDRSIELRQRLVDLSDKTCVTTPDGQGQYISLPLWYGTLNKFISHGELIYQLLTELIERGFGKQAGVAVDITNYSGSGIQSWTKWDTDSDTKHTHLVGVDTGGYDTETLRNNTENAMKTLKDEGVTSFILNMSFAIVPCDPAAVIDKDTYLDEVHKTYGELQQEVAKLEWNDQKSIDFRAIQSVQLLNLYTRTIQVKSEVNEALMGTLTDLKLDNPEDQARLLFSPIFASLRIQQFYSQQSQENLQAGFILNQKTIDPAFTMLKDLNQSSDSAIKTIIVAAAGNSGLSFPFAPAIWPNVLSVSADSVERLDFNANAGEVKLTGLYSYQTPLFELKPSTPERLNDWKTDFGVKKILPNDFQKELMDRHLLPLQALRITPQGKDQWSVVDLTQPELEYVVKDLNGMLTTSLNYVGTSFSAPRVSYLAARYLLNGGSLECIGSTSTSKPPLDHLEYNNLSLDNAKSDFCLQFPIDLP